MAKTSSSQQHQCMTMTIQHVSQTCTAKSQVANQCQAHRQVWVREVTTDWLTWKRNLGTPQSCGFRNIQQWVNGRVLLFNAHCTSVTIVVCQSMQSKIANLAIHCLPVHKSDLSWSINWPFFRVKRKGNQICQDYQRLSSAGMDH